MDALGRASRLEMPKNRTNRETALTRTDVLGLVAGVFLLGAFLIPGLSKARMKSARINCGNNLKQVGLAFRIWAWDNGDNFPMQVPVTNGGTMEVVANGTVWRHFQALSNELNTPKVVVCPSDEREPRTNSLSEAAGITQPDFCDDTAVSYFIGVDSRESQPAMLLSGDRQIVRDDTQLPPGLQLLDANQKLGWPKRLHRKEWDVGKGNIALADGSVQVVDTDGFRLLLQNSGVATNRLAIP